MGPSGDRVGANRRRRDRRGPVVGTEPTIQPAWIKAVGGAIGKANLAQIYAAAQPYAPSQGPAWKVFNTELLASASEIPQPDQWAQDPYTQTDYDAIVTMALAMIMANTPPRSAARYGRT